MILWKGGGISPFLAVNCRKSLLKIIGLRQHLRKEKKCLILKLFTDEFYNKDALESLLINLWKPIRIVSIKDMGYDIFMVIFTATEDKEKVWCHSPWSFDKKLVLLNDFDGELQPSKIQMSFWVRIYDLPFHSMSGTIGHFIGQSISEVESIDMSQDDICWCEYIHL